ncbi:hypothetical protein TNCV_3796071 [Trichonephila clavipes]|nr:hypothetical protein TNCV_3796071 [Trichonephila clavipes]
MVQHFGNLEKELLEIFNLSWATGKLPKIWKLSTVTPILKPNKNASECKNYRPLSPSQAPSASSWNGLSTVAYELAHRKQKNFTSIKQLSEPIIVLPYSFT